MGMCCSVEKTTDGEAPVVVDSGSQNPMSMPSGKNQSSQAIVNNNPSSIVTAGGSSLFPAHANGGAGPSPDAPIGVPMFSDHKGTDGGHYKGQMVHGGTVRHGSGVYAYPDGIGIYNGQWYLGKCQGAGHFRDQESEYEGQWQDDKKHGRGQEKWFEDLSEFSGDYCDGVKHGMGVYLWADGTKYEGTFEKDIIQGEGTYTAKSSVYRGQFFNSMQHGKGRQTWKDKRVYEGQYVENHRHGQGTMRWPDGHTYEGQWERGQQHGKGMEGKEGKAVQVTYNRGQRASRNNHAKSTGKPPANNSTSLNDASVGA